MQGVKEGGKDHGGGFGDIFDMFGGGFGHRQQERTGPGMTVKIRVPL